MDTYSPPPTRLCSPLGVIAKDLGLVVNMGVSENSAYLILGSL